MPELSARHQMHSRRENSMAPAQGVLEPLLLPNERIIHVAIISPFIYWKSAVMAVASLIALFYSASFAVYLLAICLVLFLLAYSTRRYLLLAATDRRLLIRCGIINAEIIQFGYNNIESLETSSMLLGQIFGYASVIISGTGRRRIVVPYVENAAAFENALAQGAFEKRA